MPLIPDQRTHGRDRVAYTLAKVALVMRDMAHNDMGDLSYNEARAFIALENRVSLLAERLMPNPEAWEQLEKAMI